MIKVFRNKKTGRLGETQFHSDADVLIANAKASGYKDDEIEIIDMEAADYNTAISQQNIDDMPQDRKDEIKIKAEIDSINRTQAIANLKSRGEIY